MQSVNSKQVVIYQKKNVFCKKRHVNGQEDSDRKKHGQDGSALPKTARENRAESDGVFQSYKEIPIPKYDDEPKPLTSEDILAIRKYCK